jgi:hypothetical protein
LLWRVHLADLQLTFFHHVQILLNW